MNASTEGRQEVKTARTGRDRLYGIERDRSSLGRQQMDDGLNPEAEAK